MIFKTKQVFLKYSSTPISATVKFLFFFICLFLSTIVLTRADSLYSNLQINPEKVSEHARKSATFTLNREVTKALYLKNPTELSLTIPFPDGPRLLKFQSNDVHAGGFEVWNATGKVVSGTLKYPHHYKSVVLTRGKEMAALSIFSDGHLVLLFSDRQGNVNVAQLPEALRSDQNPDEYVSFLDSDLKSPNPFMCGIDHDETTPRQKRSSNHNQVESDTSCRLTEIYWECDYNMFQKGGNSIQGALDRFEAMFNGTAVLYEIEAINIGIKGVKVWNTPDPYSYASSFTALDDFQAAGNAANWPGQLAHLLSTRPLNLGGVAYLNALCSSFRYGFSNIDFLFSGLPAYSWTISTIAHELGHNFSSNHTHNCGWEVAPGQLGQIDSCWNAEGDCQPQIKGRVGTIMSYCHLTGSVNLSLGFGPLPGDRIREAYANMPCVSGTIVIPNFTPVNSGPFCVGDSIFLGSENLSGYIYKWTGPNGFSSTEANPFLPDAGQTAQGLYTLSLKKAACESRGKKTEVVFNCMPIGSLPVSICAGSSLAIPFSTTGEFNPGNLFIAQLSNATGSFLNPVSIDTLVSAQPQTVYASLPSTLPLGSGYKVRFISTSPAYTGLPPVKNLVINPVGSSPQPRNGERCGTGTVEISAAGGSNLIWFSEVGELLPAGFGRKFTTPAISQTKSYFVQSGITAPSYAGLSTSFSGSSFSTSDNGLRFTANGTFRLDSVTLVHNSTSIGIPLARVTLRKNGSIWYSKDVVSSGPLQSKIALYWRLDPGTGYELKVDNIQVPLSIANAGWGAFPFPSSGQFIMDGAISVNQTDYPYLFNWVLNRYSGCPSLRIEVKAKVLNGQVPATPNLTQVSDSIFCNSEGLVYEWLINGQLQNNLNIRKIRGFQNSAYQVRLKVDSCWSEWSNPVVVSLVSVSAFLENQTSGMYPNPSLGGVQFSLKGGRHQIQIFSAAGKLLVEKLMEESDFMDLTGFARGVYFVQFKNSHSAWVEKLILE